MTTSPVKFFDTAVCHSVTSQFTSKTKIKIHEKTRNTFILKDQQLSIRSDLSAFARAGLLLFPLLEKQCGFKF
jgi:hypothetical protein